MSNKKQKTRHIILEIIEKEWPVNVSIVSGKLKHLNGTSFTVANVKYHFDQLHKYKKIRTKKIGRNLVAWPSEIEKLRIIHELLRVE
ncbi:MAG: hypothetical protein HYS80_01840 [Candidatus Aenigmarchaeota archaeon]|nr:hypothetical protein [Candidatus Aenigmarchaeota archaeon]